MAKFTGTSADDVIVGSSAPDTIDGGAGNDTLYGFGDGSGIGGTPPPGPIPFTPDDKDSLAGGTGDDQIHAFDGDDTMDGGAGRDTMEGGLGNDLYRVDDAADLPTELVDEGIDTVQSTAVAYQLTANVENLTLIGAALVGTGNDLDNQILGNVAANILAGAGGSDSIDGGSGKDVLAGGSGSDTLLGGAGDDQLSGDGENNQLQGGAGNDTLLGGDGVDQLFGDAGADVLMGGEGADDYVIDSIGDVIVETGTTDDRVSSTLSIDLTGAALAGIENAILLGKSGLTLVGDENANVLNGNVGANRIEGGGAADALFGGAGNDTLIGGEGSDYLGGEAGNDFYIVDDLDLPIVEAFDEGIDTVQTAFNHGLADNVENLILTAGGVGSGNELANRITNTDKASNSGLLGLAGNDTLVGSDGEDTLDGGEGADSMTGGEGADLYFVDNAADKIAESGKVTADADGDAADTVNTTLSSYVLGANLENLMLFGGPGSTGQGNSLNNTIVGTFGSDLLQGLAGNDTLIGDSGGIFGGNDTLDGGSGDDKLDGGDGADLLIGGDGNDTLSGVGPDVGLADTLRGGAGNDAYLLADANDQVEEFANQGTDTVFAPFDYALSDNVENLTLQAAAFSGTGNALGNALTGNDGANSLSGGLGNDTLDGGGADGEADTLDGGDGDDTYLLYAGKADVIQDSGGIDTIVSGTDHTLAADFENLTLIGADLHGVGNNLANHILGASGNDTLYGNDGSDTLEGGDGDDFLYSAFMNDPDGADDLFMGGAGNDVYYITDSGDKVFEGSTTKTDSGGYDIVVAFVTSYTLGVNVEELRLGAKEDSTGIGNALDNRIEGTFNGTNDLLQGLAGNDSLIGYDGSDTLDGGIGDDTLDGGLGDEFDALQGGAGNDRYVLPDLTADTIAELANQGIDTVVVEFTYGLGDHLENLELAGAGDIGGAGNVLNNLLTGNVGANALTGDLGNDTLDGGGPDATADTLDGGDGNDAYVIYGGGEDTIHDSGGIDTVLSHTDFSLAGGLAVLENLTLVGAAAVSGSGNDLANRILGNANDNTLSGGAGNDTLEGGAGDDFLIGDFGNDSLAGGDGNDTLDGGDIGPGDTAVETLAGGNGDDWYQVRAGVKVVENANQGNDTVQATIDYTLGANIENLMLVGAGKGTGNGLANTIVGNVDASLLIGMAGNDSLAGQGGEDTLDGGTGDDTLNGGDGDAVDVLKGGAGNDRYVIPDATADTIVESPNQGTDTVVAGFTYTLGANLENLELSGSSDIDGIGNTLNNAITGNSGVNTLAGGLGNDTLDGGGIDGSADLLDGGAGNDTYVLREDLDSIEDSGGVDTVLSHLEEVTLAADLENLTLIGAALDGTGNEAANRMIGNGEDNFLAGLDGNDTLEGGTGDDVLFGHDGNDSLVGGAGDDALIAGTGADTMVGGDGNDVYEIFGAQKIVETKGQGTDTVFIIEGVTSYTMPTEIEYLDYSESTTNVIATGNALANGITGNGQANRIDGGSGDDTLVGRGGDDSLTGGTGADSMDGADGNDLYVIDNVGDAVFESGADTEDEIRSSVALTAFVAEIEHYSFTGKTAVDFTASDVANRVTGTARNDTLRGGTGNDTLDGGAGADVLISDEGDDTYVIDNTGDRIIDLGDGIDWVHSKLAVDLTLAKFDGIENATLLGTAGLALTGDEFANELNGNTGANKIGGGAGDDSLEGDAGNDTLDGGAGADALAGGAGNDLYIIDDFGDSVDETDGSGIDTVHAFTSFTLPGDVEILRLFGGDLTGNGNDIDNLITGTDGLNYLFGAGGNDTLDGGAGIDFLGGGDGQDSILGGAGDDVLIGHGGADMLVGGSGQDTYRYLGTDALALEPADVVLGFSIGGAEQDFVDVDAVLDELGIADGDRAGRISLVDTGTNVELRIDTTGDGTFDWHAVTLKGVSSTAELSVGTGATDDIQVGTL